MSTVMLKNAGRNLVEGVFVLFLVFLAYILILGVLEKVFPFGSSVNEIVMGEVGVKEFSLLDTRDQLLKVWTQSSEEALGGGKSFSAAIEEKENSVKLKYSNSVIWRAAGKGAKLADRDAVQTFQDSSALIRINKNNYVSMGENSLLVINDMTNDQMLQEKRTRVVVLAGELKGRISGDEEDSVQLEVESSGVSTRIRSIDKSDPTEFKVQINPDQTSTISVLEGGAQVSLQDKVVNISSNQALTLSKEKFSEAPEELPEPVDMVSPVNRSEFYYKQFPRKVVFDWKQENTADGYRFELSRDREFRKVLVSKIVDKTFYTHSNLREGVYYWRVSAKRGWLESKFAEPRVIKVVQDQKAPEISVTFPSDNARAGKSAVEGLTEPGSVVFVNNEPVRLGKSGAFKHAVILNKGVNIIVVEVIDKVGNVSYVSKTINAKN